MFKKAMALAIGCGALIGCGTEPVEGVDESQEIVSNLKQAGFPDSEISVVDGVVFVGNDAVVSLQASREMLESDATKEQYSTNALVSRTLTRICINGAAFGTSGVFSDALNLAIANYNALPLTFDMVRTTSSAGCAATITARFLQGVTGGSAGFPSGGLPFNTINIGTGLSTFNVNTVEHVITHELGHTIGFRHSDWFNRSISCGSGGSEGAAGVGANLIPGTPSGAVVGGSIMNACFRQNETGEFTASDVTALNFLY